MNALTKKLMIKRNNNWLIYNAPEGYYDLLSPLPEGASLTSDPDCDADFDGIQAFVKNSEQLSKTLEIIGYLVRPETVAWISYPKKSSGMESDITMMGNWDVLSQYNLEVVAAASVDTIWTAVRIRIIGLAKKSQTANKDIKQNNFAAWIDTDNKIVTMPPDVAEALKYEPEAAELYHRLAYSHRKEYILWVITAKHEKTRAARVVKMIEKLLQNKKNPSEK